MVIFTNVLSRTSGLIGSRGARVTGADGVALTGKSASRTAKTIQILMRIRAALPIDLSKQVEPALFFDAKLDLAAPYASGNASIASLANSIASSFEYLAEDVRSLLDSLPAMFWPSKRLKYANHLPG